MLLKIAYTSFVSQFNSPTSTMANILDDLKGMVTNQIISGAASQLGESEGGISKAIGVLLPTILSGLVNKSTDSSAFSGIFNLLSDNRNAGFLDNLSGLIGGGNLAHGDPKDIAGGLMGNLFGNKVGGILDLVSSFSGVRKSSTSSLLGLAGPLIMGFLSRKIKNEGLSAAGLASFLGGQKSNIMSALPAGMGNLLGFASGFDSTKLNVSNETKVSGMNWWPWLLALLAFTAFVYFWKGCDKSNDSDPVEAVTESGENAADNTAEVVDNATEAVTDAASDLGAFFKRKLACGVELYIPEKAWKVNW